MRSQSNIIGANKHKERISHNRSAGKIKKRLIVLNVFKEVHLNLLREQTLLGLSFCWGQDEPVLFVQLKNHKFVTICAAHRVYPGVLLNNRQVIAG